MSMSSKICNIQLVKIQPKERLAPSSELNLAPSPVTDCGEARWMGYEAATQVKALRQSLCKFGLTISEEKSRIIDFCRYACQKAKKLSKKSVTFDYLDFNWQQFKRFLSFNPLPKPKIYHLVYALFKRRGCALEEPDEGEPQVRFCEGAHSNLEANTPIGGVL